LTTECSLPVRSNWPFGFTIRECAGDPIYNPSPSSDVQSRVLHFSCHRAFRVRRIQGRRRNAFPGSFPVRPSRSALVFFFSPLFSLRSPSVSFSLCLFLLSSRGIYYPRTRGGNRGDYPSRGGSLHCYPMLSATPELGRRGVSTLENP
jgi:hypothetical protein